MPIFRIITRDRLIADTLHFVKAKDEEDAKKQVQSGPASTYTEISPDWEALRKAGFQSVEPVMDDHCKERVAEAFCETCSQPICVECAKKPHS